MDSAVCDMCGCDLLGKEIRFICKIQVYAAADPLEISKKDLEKDTRQEIKDLVQKLQKAEPESLEEEVFTEMEYDFCSSCRREYLAKPLPRNSSGFNLEF